MFFLLVVNSNFDGLIGYLNVALLSKNIEIYCFLFGGGFWRILCCANIYKLVSITPLRIIMDMHRKGSSSPRHVEYTPERKIEIALKHFKNIYATYQENQDELYEIQKVNDIYQEHFDILIALLTPKQMIAFKNRIR